MKDRIRINEIKNEIEIELLKKIGDRKLICYGASSRWEDFNRLIDIWDLVEFFVDKDASRWGERYFEKEIKSPDEIMKYDSEKYAVVVLAGAFEEVGKFLDNIGWVKNKDYFNIYQYLHINIPIYRTINNFLSFLETVPLEIGHIPKKTQKKNKIGILLSIEGFNLGAVHAPYLISLFLLLKWRGYDVKLIVERLHWDGDLILFEGYLGICDKIRNVLVQKLGEMVPEEDIIYIDDVADGCLMDIDVNACKRIAEDSAKWRKWQNIFNERYMSINVLQTKYEELFCHNFCAIDKFFENNHFDVINAMTGIHTAAAVYNYAGEKRGMRVSSQDGNIEGTILISANGPASHQKDISCLLQSKWRGIIEKENIIDKAESLWKKRRGFTSQIRDMDLQEYNKRYGKESGCINFQTATESKIEQEYEVIIPLNLFYDGAMIGIQTIFGDMISWLEETIDYVINTLKCKLLIREHPIGKLLQEHYMRCELYTIYPKLIEKYEGNELFRYVKSDEDLNIYQYIESCKMVIPWTSTTGVEAGVMRKNVLVHTNVYYKNACFVFCAQSKEEYFKALRKGVLQEVRLVENDQAAYLEALRYFYYSMHQSIKTTYTIVNSDFYDWKFSNFTELLKADGVEEIIQSIAEGIPGNFLIEKKYRRDNKEQIAHD